jgi:hypothetical protein
MEGVIFLISLAIVVISTIAFVNNVEGKRFEEGLKKKAKAAQLYSNKENDYFHSLSALKNDPNNPEIKQQTLKKGREFSAFSRQYQGQNKAVTIFDEMALMNDINAACASATVVSSKTENSLSIEERLAKLSELQQKSLISEQEYNEKRQKILDEI